MCIGITTKERIYYLKGLKLVTNTKATTYFFYIPTVNLYIFKDTIQGMLKLGNKHWFINEIFY